MRQSLSTAVVGLCLTAFAIHATVAASAESPTQAQARDALHRAIRFMDAQVSADGAYLWNYTGDLTAREGEEKATATQGWVQPPGTPAVGEALLEAWLLTRDHEVKEAAVRAAHALALGQLESGGWDYVIEMDPALRGGWSYRRSPGTTPARRPKNVTTLDDDTTQSAVRFMIKMDTALQFQDELIHDCATSALDALLKAQYPNGAWPQRYDEFPDPDNHPVLKASYPDDWSREFPKRDYRSDYTLNDDTLADMVETMFLAAAIYQQPRYAEAARRGGEFILLAQMPEPQPAWAQQYDADMHPVWARRFEPPAITGGESHGAIRILLSVYRHTGDEKFLKPVPRALDYLESSKMADGQLARFYELKTNRPLFFTKAYELTYDDGDLPTHYGFKIGCGVPALRTELQRVREQSDRQPAVWTTERKIPSASSSLRAAAAEVIGQLDDRGAWTEKGELRTSPDADNGPIITTRTFMKRLQILSRFVAATSEH